MLNDWRAIYEIGLSSSFTVTGGEPFLRQDIFEVLEELRRTGFNTYILSNGTHISWELALRLAATGVKGVQISIEGPEAVHDSIRGAGSFSSSLKGIRNRIDFTYNPLRAKRSLFHGRDRFCFFNRCEAARLFEACALRRMCGRGLRLDDSS